MNKENFATRLLEFIHNPSNGITNSTENVDDDRLYYSKAIRIICVLDDKFDDYISDCIDIFNADSFGEYYFSEIFESDYGDIHVTQNEVFDTFVTFTAEEDD